MNPFDVTTALLEKAAVNAAETRCDGDAARIPAAPLHSTPAASRRTLDAVALHRYARHQRARKLGDLLMKALRGLVGTAAEWRARAEARRQLSELDDHMLRDIGLSREQVHFEARKPFWHA